MSTERTTVGFFDSGAGGLTVLAEARRAMPGAAYLFYADTDHVPYGTKTREEVLRYARRAVSFLMERGAEAIVVACNTATSMAIDDLRAEFPLPIVGMEPAVKPAARVYPGSEILICATPLTIAGKKLHTLIDRSFPDGETPTLAALPGLVAMAEEERFDPDEASAYLEAAIPRHEGYAAVVLGCTHFGYFRDSFRRVFGNVDIIDGNRGTVRRLISLLGGTRGDGEGSVTIFESGRQVCDPGRLARYARLLARAQRAAEEN
ncbi:MAG: glutamate racemase [Clostridia bacterium]|nr:glutamate racemase [Clostridia bacterium]